ncbi:E3 ubiquitin-protein ligase TRIM33-like [Mya arenaria]|uniref:E3 ubiquitin-protein ligase TRIM33-like n=1 Tax=Mya arenaria TaxID=6604 RepID=UPI0022E4520D|nr:E3 ubiquitin-protein ligase TRIM33-like [Mya arenaria]
MEKDKEAVSSGVDATPAETTIFCTACSVNEKASHMCIDCDTYYCDSCLKDHNKLANLRSHLILVGDEMKSRGTKKQLPTDRCEEHNGKHVDMFCVYHKVVCCSACAAIKHRSCKNVQYIPDVSSGTKTSQDFKEALNKVKEMRGRILRVEREKYDNIQSIENEERDILKQIDEYSDQIKLKIDELAGKSKEQVKEKHDSCKKEIEEAKAKLQSFLTQIALLEKSESPEVKNESQVFVDMKKSNNIVDEVKKEMDKFEIEYKMREVKFDINKEVLTSIEKHAGLGQVQPDKAKKGWFSS